MNKQLQTISPVIPKGYTGKLSDFNMWQLKIQKEIDRIKKTNVSERMVSA